MPFTSHEEYFAAAPTQARPLLERIQRAVQQRLPDAQRCIGYSMPAFRQQRIFFYFAAFKNHIGVYPPVSDDPALVAELAPYRGPKGNLTFPYRQHLPLDLIVRVAVALAKQYARR